MADKRITGLLELTNPTLSDEMHINDVLSNFDKKILLLTLRKLLSVPYMQVSISNYNNDLAPVVQSGSSFDNKGIPTDITSDATPTGYSGIAVSTTFYLYYDESASAFIYSETVPTWNAIYQGWYNGDDRAFFSMYKDSEGTLYQRKQLLKKSGELYTNVINFAPDADLLWDESEDAFVMQKSLIYPAKRITSTNYVEGTTSEDVLFDKLSPYIPNVGDGMAIHGATANNNNLVYRCYKYDATTIHLKYINDTYFAAHEIRNGNTTTWKFALAW